MRERQANGRSRQWGFTLIELLVVVAIISLLISILTPSLSRAREQAKSTVCLTRLSEFMKITVMYQADNDYQLPPALYYATANQETNAPLHGWAEAMYVYTYQDKFFSQELDFPVQRNEGDKFELWVCKEATPKTLEAGNAGHYRVYSVSWDKGSLERVKPRLPLICDANPLVTDPDDLRRSDIPREHIAGLAGEAYIDERHYGGANYAFNDGHAARSTKLKDELAEDWDLDPDTENQ